jgi:hypothetical protein
MTNRREATGKSKRSTTKGSVGQSRNQISEYLSQRRKGRKVKDCHFEPFDNAQDKLREKSFLDPAHSLGMTGTARHLALLAAWRERIVAFLSYRQSCFVARRAPSAIAWNFAQTIFG